MVIYLIVGTTSLYTWNVIAYRDETQANEHVEKANKIVEDDVFYIIEKMVVK